MALFKSADDKAEEQAKKERKLLKKYGVDELSDPRDMESVKKIAQELLGTTLQEAGMKIAMAKPEVQLSVSYQRAIMEQNFIMIRQLDRIAQLLSEK